MDLKNERSLRQSADREMDRDLDLGPEEGLEEDLNAMNEMDRDYDEVEELEDDVLEEIDTSRSEASRYNEEEYLNDDQPANDRKDDNHRVVN